MFWLGVLALVIVYGAYVAEVYRARHREHPLEPDRRGPFTRAVAVADYRYVIVPQAVRRMFPPLLNDFVGLRKTQPWSASSGCSTR